MGTPRDEASSEEDREGLDPTPPEGGYEICSVPSSPGEYSVPGGTFPKDGFEEHYEKVAPRDSAGAVPTQRG